ncbi:MAG: serine/threonine protein kinase [Clostridia bacterium]|nr:serine/threonine protein kinase [Deltaproteobacteria bacterium]
MTTAAPAELQERFGPYTLVRKIGQGGMAEVFLAYRDGQTQGTKPVVIKRLHQELENNRDAVDLFLTEADVTMLLEHPNVIRVHDSGEVEGRYYIAMEYVHGKDLGQITDRLQQLSRKFDVDLAVHIAIEMLRGLSYVHNAKTVSGRALGVVHRDCTPSNIYVSTSGQVKLGDFGVAKLVGVEGWTMAGSLKGKLGYLSPEQIAGDSPTQSIDLWSASICLFEMLTMQRAFVGDNELEVMLRIKAARVPRLRGRLFSKAEIDAVVPKPLIVILEKALHKKESNRYQTAAELLAALEAYRAKNGRTYNEAELVHELTKSLS